MRVANVALYVFFSYCIHSPALSPLLRGSPSAHDLGSWFLSLKGGGGVFPATDSGSGVCSVQHLQELLIIHDAT